MILYCPHCHNEDPATLEGKRSVRGVTTNPAEPMESTVNYLCIRCLNRFTTNSVNAPNQVVATEFSHSLEVLSLVIAYDLAKRVYTGWYNYYLFSPTYLKSFVYPLLYIRKKQVDTRWKEIAYITGRVKYNRL